MTICKYFLQGTCRFGENCKFEHQLGSSDHIYAGSNSILLQNYASKPAQAAPANVDTNTLVKSVVNDMTSAEKGGQWLLSSYAPFKEKPAFPGFEDHSMEEIRYLFYESLRNGTLEQYKHNLQMMLQQAVMKVKALQNPSPDIVNILKSIYHTTASSTFNNNSNQSPFGAAPANSQSVFGGGTQNNQKSVFASAPPNQSVFGNTPQMQQSIFGGSPNNAVFGQNPVFAQQQSSPTKSIFGGSPQMTPNAIFGGGTQPAIGGQVQENSQFMQSSPFNQQPFAAPQPNIFQQGNQIGAPQNANQFPALQPPQATTTPIAGNKPAFQHSASIFGNVTGQQAPTINMISGNVSQTKPDEDFYSKLEELTEEEMKWFQSDDLDMQKIPEKPPTYEMCFRV